MGANSADSGNSSIKADGSRRLLWSVLALLILAVIGLSLAGPVWLWPMTDEANYLLEARKLAEGQLPYRDFYEFITPGGQLIGSLLIRLLGFSVVALRLLVLLGWGLEAVLLWQLSGSYLTRPWRWLMLAFFWLTVSRYPVYQHHFWSGLSALLAVWAAVRYLSGYYGGFPRKRWLMICGLLCAITFWITQSLGLLMAGALMGFSLLHCFLHEKEEKGITYGQVKNAQVLARWLKSWGRNWALPMLGVHLLCLLTLIGLGIQDEFMRDSVRWLAGGHYAGTTVLGYYSTFQSELMDTLRPVLAGLPLSTLPYFIWRLPIALHVFLIGVIPIVGILGIGYLLPARFVFRLLQRDDEILLLLWLAALALIVSTFSYSTSMHIASNGSLAFLLGWVALSQAAQRNARLGRWLPPVSWILFALLLIGAAVGSYLQLTFGSWLPRFSGMREAMLYTDGGASAPDFLAVVARLQEATDRNRTVFVLNETPSLYLPDHSRNATRFTLVIPLYTTRAQMREIMAELQRNRPLYIVDDQSMRFLDRDVRFTQYPADRLRLPKIESFLQNRYQLLEVRGRYKIYRSYD